MEINCLITDDENIRKFNRRYRAIDGPTDVLSFALMEEPAGCTAADFPPVPGTSCAFGDIIISYPRAAAQAAELGHSIMDELTLLLVHGTLHLLGFDHQKANEAKKMARHEKAIIRTLS
jgi:probable rRNA maturation factor